MEGGNDNYNVLKRYFDLTSGEEKNPGHIQKTTLMEPETGILYVKEETDWRRYTS